MAVALLFLLSIWCAAISTGGVWFWLKAYQSGVFKGRSSRAGKIRITRRSENPAAFWVCMAIFGTCISVGYAFSLGLFLNALAFNTVQT